MSDHFGTLYIKGLNPWITLSDGILLFVMSSKSSFVTGSFVFLKEVLHPFLSSSILFSLFTSSSCISGSTMIFIALYFGNFSVLFIFTLAAFFCISFFRITLPVHSFFLLLEIGKSYKFPFRIFCSTSEFYQLALNNAIFLSRYALQFFFLHLVMFISCSKLRHCDSNDNIQGFVGGKSTKLLPRSSFAPSCSSSLCSVSSEWFPSFSILPALGDSCDQFSAAKHSFPFE